MRTVCELCGDDREVSAAPDGQMSCRRCKVYYRSPYERTEDLVPEDAFGDRCEEESEVPE